MGLTVEAQGGLCNRMRALDSALALGRETGVRVTLAWFRNAELNCPFDRLFAMPSAALQVVDRGDGGLGGRIARQFRPSFVRLKGAIFLGQQTLASARDPGELVKRALEKGEVYVATHSRFHEGERLFEGFDVAPAMHDKLEPYRDALAGSVGVHIRRTDNLQAIRAASEEAFIAAMEDELERCATTRFFVATDDARVLERLRRRFGGAVAHHPKRAYSRNDPLAIEDALVDLYALASCRALIGSYWSSFTDTAAQLGRMDARILGGAEA